MKRKLTYINLDTVDYKKAWNLQKILFDLRYRNEIDDVLILLEHPHTYTLGKTAHKENLIGDEKFLENNHISVYEIDRGGDITYHGPGQVVGYPIINLENWKKDTHKYLRALEEVLINVCKEYNLNAERIEGLTGVWIENRKIAAIGIKVSRWITMHGFAFNVNTNLEMFKGIIPCGIKDKAVTSLKSELKKELNIDDVKQQIVNKFLNEFEYDEVELLESQAIKNFELKLNKTERVL